MECTRYKADSGLLYFAINEWYFFKIIPTLLAFLVFGSCDKEDAPIDISPIVHGWKVVSFTAPQASAPQNAIGTYLLEFANDKTYSIDFDRYGCGSTFNISKNGKIRLEPFIWDFCSSTTQYAKDLQKLLLASTSYSISGDSSLTLSGTGEIILKRTSDCANAACQLTMRIGSIHMTIKRTDGSDVILTSSKLIRLSDNVIIISSEYPPRLPDWPTNLPYRLIDDSYMKELRGKKVMVEFQGFINDKMVVRETFTIGEDCCNVILVSGNLDIVVD